MEKNTQKLNKAKKLDLAILFLFPIMATIISLKIKANMLVGTLLFFAAPSIYLSFRGKELIKKTAFVSAIFAIWLLLFDYWANINSVWIENTMFSSRIFGVLAYEMIIWQFFFVYFVIIFYEYFLDKGKNKVVEKNISYLVKIIFVVLILILVQVIGHFGRIEYFYLWLGISLALIPAIFWIFFLHKPISKFIKAGVYFFVVYFLYELTALQLNHWEFLDNKFIGEVTIFNLSFPFEELFFWMILGAIGGLSLYEFFADDKK